MNLCENIYKFLLLFAQPWQEHHAKQTQEDWNEKARYSILLILVTHFSSPVTGSPPMINHYYVAFVILL